MNELERLLSTPLSDIRDDGFSLKVLKSIRKKQRQVFVLMSCMLAGIATVFVVFIAKISSIGLSLLTALPSSFKLLGSNKFDFTAIAHDALVAMQTPAGLFALTCLLIVSCLIKFDL